MDGRERGPVRPPRVAEKILGLLHSDRGSSTHLGDFAEIYAAIATEQGSAAARFWYGRQILLSIPGFLAVRFYWSAVMFRNYLVIFARNIRRDKGTALLDFAGLTAGLACLIVILVYVGFETRYDRFHAKADRIHRVLSGSTARGGQLNTSTPDVLAAALPAHVPGVVRAALVYPDSGQCSRVDDEGSYSLRGLFTDQVFLEMFSFPIRRGGARAALAGPSSIVLTESAARKLFGREDPLGKIVIRKSMGGRRDLTVTAVLRDAPPNSHLQFDYLVSLETLRASTSASDMFGSWDIAYFTTYLELAPGQSRFAVESGIPDMISRVAGDKDRSFMTFSLQPLMDIHLRSRSISGDTSTGDIRSVRLFLAIALLILSIACANHVNLATAQAAVRAREIGIRKITGAQRSQVFRQFMAESLTMTSAAGLVAFGLVVLALPRFEHLFGMPAGMFSGDVAGFCSWLAATVAFVGLASGIYPAFVLSGVAPGRIFKPCVQAGTKGASLRSLLVVLQFAASVVLIMMTLVVSGQMKYVRSERLGYNREHVVVVPAREQETLKKLPVIRAALEERAEVAKASVSSALPTEFRVRYYGLRFPQDDGTEVRLDFNVGYADENFLDVYEIELVAGRNFRPGDKDVMLINEIALKETGWRDPLGKKFRGGPIEVVGIVKDFHIGSLHKKTGPTALVYGSGGAQISVRVRPGDLSRTIGTLRSVFERQNPGQPFEFYFLDDAYDALYQQETRAGRMFGAFAGLAVLLACLGLFGLTSFNVSRRRREIGIRRVLGASASGLMFLLNRDFARPIAIGNVLAWPVAFLAMSAWLRNFAYRVPIRPDVFALSSLLSLVIGFMVVGIRTAKAAMENPSTTLRFE